MRYLTRKPLSEQEYMNYQELDQKRISYLSNPDITSRERRGIRDWF
jgi:hypothetical protein